MKNANIEGFYNFYGVPTVNTTRQVTYWPCPRDQHLLT